ncbi:hypothetical protein HU200_028511 [Digitaria exilis]|uniref:Uncharacterized protein n=1 Tax=Digitaria exilis TaxID=1010633 RepID=A0A835BUL9_9POAL|nr:hypothetical protein HU200_028511 [Digitaria exilis]
MGEKFLLGIVRLSEGDSSQRIDDQSGSRHLLGLLRFTKVGGMREKNYTVEIGVVLAPITERCGTGATCSAELSPLFLSEVTACWIMEALCLRLKLGFLYMMWRRDNKENPYTRACFAASW